MINVEVKTIHSEDLKIVYDDVLTNCGQLQQFRPVCIFIELVIMLE